MFFASSRVPGCAPTPSRAQPSPQIFKDCQNCPRLYKCDEVAMARGQVPKVSILGPRIEAEQLVRLTT
ncbi:MAG TPA: hypothetical protein VME18_04680 [Acidobacteriaceae bacterium]|nr:hypothetical protein [Acidobacteriaceae bacterium]